MDHQSRMYSNPVCVPTRTHHDELKLHALLSMTCYYRHYQLRYVEYSGKKGSRIDSRPSTDGRPRTSNNGAGVSSHHPHTTTDNLTNQSRHIFTPPKTMQRNTTQVPPEYPHTYTDPDGERNDITEGQGEGTSTAFRREPPSPCTPP
jgi:hypothetical protein